MSDISGVPGASTNMQVFQQNTVSVASELSLEHQRAKSLLGEERQNDGVIAMPSALVEAFRQHDAEAIMRFMAQENKKLISLMIITDNEKISAVYTLYFPGSISSGLTVQKSSLAGSEVTTYPAEKLSGAKDYQRFFSSLGSLQMPGFVAGETNSTDA
ncbi:hypothetical protein N5923_17090 [Erwiniaceae bacterium BAC15a-03b]|uniref:Uncharacterized protein n=1 Tax=Winslowiella arboricola TaxID=2978220 RepID=A0A9J6PLK6_9GAMM|nr:hypothetical protein [Winslowiella arboricola]MCU5773315.1 hypothetical protein [Winslowiella arboricola]MCU5779201.1 hypothetical protein [Winslowiella arboricola]